MKSVSAERHVLVSLGEAGGRDGGKRRHSYCKNVLEQDAADHRKVGAKRACGQRTPETRRREKKEGPARATDGFAGTGGRCRVGDADQKRGVLAWGGSALGKGRGRGEVHKVRGSRQLRKPRSLAMPRLEGTAKKKTLQSRKGRLHAIWKAGTWKSCDAWRVQGG